MIIDHGGTRARSPTERIDTESYVDVRRTVPPVTEAGLNKSHKYGSVSGMRMRVRQTSGKTRTGGRHARPTNHRPGHDLWPLA